jgi:hypothetical protein
MAILLIHSLHIYLLSIYSVSVDISLEGVYICSFWERLVQECKNMNGKRGVALDFLVWNLFFMVKHTARLLQYRHIPHAYFKPGHRTTGRPAGLVQWSFGHASTVDALFIHYRWHRFKT